MDTTRLAPERYLELLTSDGRRLGEVAEDSLDTPVPTCPGWDVRDVVLHTGSVFNHKVACIRLGERPEEGTWSTEPGPDQDLLEWYFASLSALTSELVERGPDYVTFAWYEPEQSTAFWYRRMAQEAVVHRVDVETAASLLTPAEDDLALDGIDELLDIFVTWGVGDDPEEDVTAFDGHSLLVRAGGRAWHLSGHSGDPAGQIVLSRAAAPADVVVTGEPSELLLWLWGRRPDSAVTIRGERLDVLPVIRELLVRATQ